MRLLLLVASLAFAQIEPKPESTPVKAALPEAVFSETLAPRDEPRPMAQAISLAFGATFFVEVRISTMGAVTDLSRLAADGFYKRELITLLLIAGKGKAPLADLAARRRKGEPLRKLAEASGLDFDAVYESALAVEKDVDRRYLKLFPERRPRRGRDE